jgi:hypothetical protein
MSDSKACWNMSLRKGKNKHARLGLFRYSIVHSLLLRIRIFPCFHGGLPPSQMEFVINDTVTSWRAETLPTRRSDSTRTSRTTDTPFLAVTHGRNRPTPAVRLIAPAQHPFTNVHYRPAAATKHRPALLPPNTSGTDPTSSTTPTAGPTEPLRSRPRADVADARFARRR